MGLNDSSLVTYSRQAHADNYRANRGKLITEITIHHCAGELSVETVGNMWNTPKKYVSSHYAVSEKDVGQYVCENDVAFTNGGTIDSNSRAVTIETSNNGGAPSWPVSLVTLNTLILLVADIARRNNLGKLTKGQNLTWHSMYKATECPGPFLTERLQQIVESANRINGY